MSFSQEDPAIYAGDQNLAPSRDDLAKVLNQLAFPNLTSFEFMAGSMKFDYPFINWPKGAMDAFMGFPEKSGSSLKTLSLRDLSIPHQKLVTVLRSMLSIVELMLGDVRLAKVDVLKDDDALKPTVSSAF
ncbi:hypothetical protein BT96DRAFT_944227 [Gymnopus androsaceus JB14]|uniref:Uncharacterized protein n=1 Tax=Gymnopus androsaceus JB14 TaxID=1447944 RepID=A0A6A4H4M3_9AGAR|nr:hypothetical protein BT96DRAFT_944227 [Gymnopus androsaceus JB14]